MTKRAAQNERPFFVMAIRPFLGRKVPIVGCQENYVFPSLAKPGAVRILPQCAYGITRISSAICMCARFCRDTAHKLRRILGSWLWRLSSQLLISRSVVKSGDRSQRCGTNAVSSDGRYNERKPGSGDDNRPIQQHRARRRCDRRKSCSRSPSQRRIDCQSHCLFRPGSIGRLNSPAVERRQHQPDLCCKR